MPRTLKTKSLAIVAFDDLSSDLQFAVGTRFVDRNRPNDVCEIMSYDRGVYVVSEKSKTDGHSPRIGEYSPTLVKFHVENSQFVDKTLPKDTPRLNVSIVPVVDPIETDEDDDDGEIDIENISDFELLAMKHDMTVDELTDVVVQTSMFDPSETDEDDEPELSDDDDGDDDDDGSDDDTTETPISMSDIDLTVQNNAKPDTGEQRIGGTVDDDIAGILFTTMASLKITKNEALSMAISLLATSDKEALKKALANVYQSRLEAAFKS